MRRDKVQRDVRRYWTPCAKMWRVPDREMIQENDKRYQLDATIVIYYHKCLYMFRASICPSLGEQVVCCIKLVPLVIFIYDTICLLTAIGLTPGGSSTVHIYTQTVHRTTQNKQYIEQHNNFWECGTCPVLARFTLAFALQLRKKHGKTSVRVAASKNI